MKINRYYQEVLSRENSLKHLIMRLFISVSSAPRLLLEVFTRENFGERYFSFSAAIFVSIVLFSLPFGFGVFHVGSIYSYDSESPTFFQTIWHNFFWYVYIGTFLYFSFKRRQEFTRSRSSFDFSRYSKASGDLNKRLLQLEFNGKRVTTRQVEIFIEPSLFFFTGLFLAIIGQSLGFLLLFCSLFYSLSYYFAYRLGDDFVLEAIDKLICGQEFENFFVEGLDSRETRGFRGYGRPADPRTARKVADIINDDDEIVDIDFDEIK